MHLVSRMFYLFNFRYFILCQFISLSFGSCFFSFICKRYRPSYISPDIVRRRKVCIINKVISKTMFWIQLLLKSPLTTNVLAFIEMFACNNWMINMFICFQIGWNNMFTCFLIGWFNMFTCFLIGYHLPTIHIRAYPDVRWSCYANIICSKMTYSVDLKWKQ